MIKVMPFRSIAVVLSIVVLTSCSTGGSNASSTDKTYNDTKTMVLDILKSDDGKKAMMSAVQGGAGGEPQIKQLTASDSKMLQVAVKNVMTSPENKNMMQKMVTDPKFAGDFAKAIQQDTKQIHKDLMKDPEYQKYMLDLMKNPQFQTVLLDSTKTVPFRQQMKTVTQETLQSPLFKGELIKLMETAVSSYMQKEQTPKQDQGGASAQSKKDGGGDQKSKDSSGGGGDQSSGGGDQSGDGSGDQSQDDQKKKDQQQ